MSQPLFKATFLFSFIPATSSEVVKNDWRWKRFSFSAQGKRVGANLGLSPTNVASPGQYCRSASEY